MKTEFLAHLTHELRTPLNAVIGLAAFIESAKAGPITETQREYLRDIVGNSRHLLRLVDDILDLARIDAGKLEFHFERAQLAPIAKDFGVANTVIIFGTTTIVLAGIVDNICNGGARPLFGWVSDNIGREYTMAIAFGLVNGWLIAYAEVPSLFTTLASGLFLAGLGQAAFFQLDVVQWHSKLDAFAWIGRGTLLGIPMPIVMFA